MKSKKSWKVLAQREIAPGIFDLTLDAPQIASEAAAGQFVNLYCADRTRLLPRPISICGIDRTAGTLRLVYRVNGRGTEEFSGRKAGDCIEVMGPLGNGFPLSAADGKRVLLVGGGIGVPPMLETARSLKDRANVTCVIGYRDRNTFLLDDFEETARTFIASDDGSVGIHGNVIDAIRENNIEADILFACGPVPMLRGLKAYAEEQGIPCYVSMEERMACGIGACLGCVCRTAGVDDHSKVHNARVCKDGPVFRAEEVEL